MALRFPSKRKTDIRNVNTGVDSYTVSVDFVPNFVTVYFTDIKNVPVKDEVFWSAASTATGYDFTIDYTCNEPRVIKFVAAVMPVNPEELNF